MAILGKKQMSEEDIKLNYITPVIQRYPREDQPECLADRFRSSFRYLQACALVVHGLRPFG